MHAPSMRPPTYHNFLSSMRACASCIDAPWPTSHCIEMREPAARERTAHVRAIDSKPADGEPAAVIDGAPPCPIGGPVGSWGRVETVGSGCARRDAHALRGGA